MYIRLLYAQHSLSSVTIQLAEYYYDEEMMQVNPAPDVSLPPEPTNAAYLENYLSDSDDEGNNKCSEN